THLLLHSFPTRRSSDLHQRASPLFPINAPLAVMPIPSRSNTGGSVTSPGGAAGTSPRKSMRPNSAASQLGCLTTACAWPSLVPRSEEHTSELQSRSDLV